jgi:diketogulonate reductase-like aldo/keto reductase
VYPRPVPLRETLEAMAELRAEGKVRNVGVSNFSHRRLKRAEDLSPAPIFTDQVQYHPYWLQSDLRDYCRIHDLLLTAYSPLARGGVLEDSVVKTVGDAHGKTPAQVAIRWPIQHPNVVTVPKAISPQHLIENLEVFDFELTEAELEAIRRPSKRRALSGFLKGFR